MKKRIYIYILAVLLVVAAGIALMRPESDEPTYTPPPVYVDDDDDTPVAPAPVPQNQEAETFVKKLVAAYEDAVDVLYNLKGKEAVSRLENIEVEIEGIDAQVAELSDAERQKVEQHPSLLEVKKKYDTAVEQVKIGGSRL